MPLFGPPEEQTDRNDVPLPQFTIAKAADRRACFRNVDRILSYFEQKTAGRRLPCRADVSPSELKAFLPNVCLIVPTFDENGAISDGILQLMGTNVVSFYGEMTGKSIFDHDAPEVPRRILACMNRCSAERAPLLGEAASLSADKAHLTVTVLYVPLSEDNRHIDRFFLLTEVRGRMAAGEQA